MIRASLAEAVPAPFWTSQRSTDPRPPLGRAETADLVVVGGGFTGLWAAWRALERGEAKEVVIVEAREIGYGASGRNGGFMSASLTHGLTHGLSIWPDQAVELHHEGMKNLREMVQTIREAGIECDLREAGESTVAVEPWQVEDLEAAHRESLERGIPSEFQTAEQIRADVHSPTYLAAIRDREGTVMVDPARLAWGLAEELERRGVRIRERSEVTRIRTTRTGVKVQTVGGSVTARHAIVATAAYPQSPLKRLRSYIMPLYDHVLMTEPLTDAQWAEVGWKDRQGISDAGNQFHYYRPTADGRILWGGWDAVYHPGGRVDEKYEQSPSHELLARHFFETFPQLEGLRFTHRWAGPIDSTTRFTAAYGTARGGRVAYAVGHTGLGVGASRFSADVALDLLNGEPTSRTRYDIARRRPMPVPPEPFRNPIIQFTRRSILAADANQGRRNLWLRTLDRFGLGFNS